MRNCGLWITPWVKPNEEVIIDTAAMTEAEWRAVVHEDPDVPPTDTILVCIHPAREAALKKQIVSSPAGMLDYDVRGTQVAASIIDARCFRDPELRRRLRWTW